MRKFGKGFVIILLLLLLFITGCKGPAAVPMQQETLIVEDLNGMSLEKLTHYNMDIVFTPEEAMLDVVQKIDYINNETVDLDKLYFHLYPNAFRSQETTPFLFDDFHRAYPEGFEPGFIDLIELRIGKEKADYRITGEGNTILEVALPHALKPGSRTPLEMAYKVKLPPAQERFGYGENTFNFGNWYPVAAVYDENGWNLDPYYPIGDPFYSDVSNYDVKIETPKDMVIAATGNIVTEGVDGDKKIWQIEARLIRDFAWVASKDFEVVEKDVDGTILKMYFIKDRSMKQDIKDWATQAAENSLRIFNRTFGKYPYGQYSVVQTNFPSGMEYPGIVFIGKQYYDKQWKSFLEVVIVHETAHQWWYGIVGNNQIEEAWLDESLAAYSEVVYAMEAYGEERGQQYHAQSNEDEYKQAAQDIQDEVILKSLQAFQGWYDYGPLVYSKGAMFLNEIYTEYGKDTLYQILSEYYHANRFKNVRTGDFRKICEEVTGKDLGPLFDKWLLAK